MNPSDPSNAGNASASASASVAGSGAASASTTGAVKSSSHATPGQTGEAQAHAQEQVQTPTQAQYTKPQAPLYLDLSAQSPRPGDLEPAAEEGPKVQGRRDPANERSSPDRFLSPPNQQVHQTQARDIQSHHNSSQNLNPGYFDHGTNDTAQTHHSNGTNSPEQPNSTDLGFDAVTPGIDPFAYTQSRTSRNYRPRASRTRRDRLRVWNRNATGATSALPLGYLGQENLEEEEDEDENYENSDDDDDDDDEVVASYFSLSDRRIRPRQPSVAGVLKKTASGQQTLGDMDTGRRESLSEIRQANPDLALSGNIISATFNIPHAFSYRKSGDWVLKPRRGQSALFDSFTYLSSDACPWQHTVISWTGEIDFPHEVPFSPPGTPASTTVGASSLNALSAPVPVESGARLPTPPPVDGLWVPKEDQLRLENQLSHNKTIRTIPVWLADENDESEKGIALKDQARWRRYAEQDLYDLFHYKQHEPSDGRKERIQWADYYRMNQKFANKIIEVYKPGDIVVVHDYYLMLVPSMLRQRVPNMYISFFLHCPFPSSEFLRCLPRRKEVLEGILGANLVGFQSYSYARHFLSCCTRILGFPSDALGIDAYGTRVQVGIFPIGIDAAKVEGFAWVPAVNAKYDALKQLYKGKKIIVGRDRLDSVRGVAQKLQAFERFLENYPEWREKVVLIQVTSPTSTENDKEEPENRIASRVNELVMKINGQYGSLGFSPVQHYPQYLGQDEYFALLRAADIGLITSVRDGMNTTSLEYIVCQKQNNGPLILSEFSGTAGSLGDAIHINPWDLGGVAEKIHFALTMSEDRRMAMQTSLYRHVTTHNVQSWTTKFLRNVQSVLGDSNSANATPLLDRAHMLSQYRDAGKRLFLFDYDGTLTPIVREPSAAIPSERIIHALQVLTKDPKNHVWIISGRDQEFLKQHLGHISQLGFSAEHGSFMRNPGSEEWENLAETFDMGWQEEVVSVFQKYTDRVPGSFIERKRCALTWHYRLADPDQGIHMAKEAQKELENGVATRWDVDVMPGKANVEVRPTFINKGEITKRLVNTYHDPDNSGPIEFSLCMGDDFTDEDMFRSLNGLSGTTLDAGHVFTVTVGPSTKVTLAKWHLLEPHDVIECVVLLAAELANDANQADVGLVTEKLSGVNLAALSTVEGHIPDKERDEPNP